MEIEVLRDTTQELRVAVSGDLRRPANEFRDPLCRAMSGKRGRQVVLDLAAVASMDSGGVHWLLATRHALRGAGGRLALVGAPSCVEGPLRLLNLLDGFLDPDAKEAPLSEGVA